MGEDAALDPGGWHLGQIFPKLLPLLKSIPQPWVGIMDPGMGMIMGYNKICEAKIREIMSERKKSTQKAYQKMSALPTLFKELLDSDLPPQEKTFARLADECQSVIGAGTETTTHALEVIAYHLLDSPDILQKLRDELDQVNPDRSVQVPFRDLEQLPYLVREKF
ncbi:cytochrome P450 [Lipomyces mesembrius]